MLNRGTKLRGLAPTRTIDAFGLYGISNSGTAPSSGTFPTANKVFYCPVRTPCPLTVALFYAYNGATVSGNIEVGLYSIDGVRLATSGSVAQAGTNGAQIFDIADKFVGEGVFYLAVSMDNTTGTLFRTANPALLNAAMGMLVETTVSFGLPAIWSPGTMVDAFMPRIGMAMAVVL